MEVFSVDIKYDSKELYNHFNELTTEQLEDTAVTYKKNIKWFEGNTISELKKAGTNRPGLSEARYETRRDLVAYPDLNNKAIAEILNQLQGFKIGLVAFFKQRAGEDVPLHVDYPYRKNTALMIPIFYNGFKLTDAVTYYENGGSYKIKKPVIMDVMKRHGVKNITDDRLMLQIELPEKKVKALSNKFKALKNG